MLSSLRNLNVTSQSKHATAASNQSATTTSNGSQLASKYDARSSSTPTVSVFGLLLVKFLNVLGVFQTLDKILTEYLTRNLRLNSANFQLQSYIKTVNTQMVKFYQNSA